MNTCCPNCASNSAIGNELASVCTECASVSAAGFSFSMPILAAGWLCAWIDVDAFGVPACSHSVSGPVLGLILR